MQGVAQQFEPGRDVLYLHDVPQSAALRMRLVTTACFACNDLQASPAQHPTWGDAAELRDLFSVYIGRPTDSANQAILQQVLGISDSEVDSLKDIVTSGEFHLEQLQKEEAFF